jgi:hypothetical protein
MQPPHAKVQLQAINSPSGKLPICCRAVQALNRSAWSVCQLLRALGGAGATIKHLGYLCPRLLIGCSRRKRRPDLRGRDAFSRFVPERERFLSATDRCARPGSHVGQNGRPRYLWPREQVFHPPRFAFGIRALLIEGDFLPVVASA